MTVFFFAVFVRPIVKSLRNIQAFPYGMALQTIIILRRSLPTFSPFARISVRLTPIPVLLTWEMVAIMLQIPL